MRPSRLASLAPWDEDCWRHVSKLRSTCAGKDRTVAAVTAVRLLCSAPLGGLRTRNGMDPRVTSPRSARLRPEDDEVGALPANRQRPRLARPLQQSSSSGLSPRKRARMTRGSIPFDCGRLPGGAERSGRIGIANHHALRTSPALRDVLHHPRHPPRKCEYCTPEVRAERASGEPVIFSVWRY